MNANLPALEQHHVGDYDQLLELFIRLIDSRAGTNIEPGDEWLNDAQTLAVKLFRHLMSMKILACVGTIKQDNFPPSFFIDHSSVKVVTRAALESYLVYFYLYGSGDLEMSKFRHKTWHLAGLSDRQRHHASTDESRHKLSSEKLEINNLRLEIQASPQISGYTHKQQIQLLDGNWRVGTSWIMLGTQAGFHTTYFENVYSYLCGYSHSSYISALQVGQAQTLEDQNMLAQSCTGIGLIIMAHFVTNYASSVNAASVVLASNADTQLLIKKWRITAAELDPIYSAQDKI